jgi:DNA-binding transcriptional ArsR family regulator
MHADDPHGNGRGDRDHGGPARFEGPADPTDALSVLADETRLAILRALADADDPLSFSRLRDRAGVSDSGRFSYHLRQLCEYFVRETPDGYELGHAGARVIDASKAAGGDPVDPASAVDASTGECPVCGESDCDRLIHVHLSPPSV